MGQRKSGELGRLGEPIYWVCAGAGLVLCSQLITGWARPAGATGWWEIVAAFGTVGAVIAAVTQANSLSRRYEMERAEQSSFLLNSMAEELTRLRVVLLSILHDLEIMHIGAQSAYERHIPYTGRDAALDRLRQARELMQTPMIHSLRDQLHLVKHGLGVEAVTLEQKILKVMPWMTALGDRKEPWFDLHQVLTLSELSINELSDIGDRVCRLLAAAGRDPAASDHFRKFPVKLRERLAAVASQA